MADPARARKVADRIKTVIAEGLDSTVKDPDLGFVTITDVRVTNDLQHASIFYTVFGDQTQRELTAALLERHRGKLRSLVGRHLGIRLTPTVEFIADAIPETAAALEDLLATAKERDAALAASKATATYAGDPDPYRTPAEEDSDPHDGASVDDRNDGSVGDPAVGADGVVGAEGTGRGFHPEGAGPAQ